MHLHQNFFPWEVSALSGSVVGVVFGGFGFGFFFIIISSVKLELLIQTGFMTLGRHVTI